MKKIVLGILAHVDSGKTTLSEALLYESGAISSLGRVDHKNAFLDTDSIERDRGITIFSKEAQLCLPNTKLTLLDTPGHVDFSAEAERTLCVLDYAILVISASDGVQSHSKTLWNFLSHYNIPTFIFVNKMDLPTSDKYKILSDIIDEFGDGCIDFSEFNGDFYENIATVSQALLDEYLESGSVSQKAIKDAIASRAVFPCLFGSALKLEGVNELLSLLDKYTAEKRYGNEFGAIVYKISEDIKGQRLSHMKITGGTLKVKSLLNGEKVNDIRIYSGEKYESVQEVSAGSVCCVAGLMKTQAGDGIGSAPSAPSYISEPVLTYAVHLPKGTHPHTALEIFKKIEEEDPQLRTIVNEDTGEINIQIMGEIQLEVLVRILEERFNLKVTFGDGSIIYKETIKNTVEGVGHYEPLRHYAEVHLLLEPAKRGSGLSFCTDCPEDLLSKNWQRLVLTHLAEKTHRGVLTGSALTDVKITLINGRAHIKHTDGGDFRQATYRAVRQGLMQAESVLLEPWYSFVLEVPLSDTGRAMTDLAELSANFSGPETDGEISRIKGTAPISKIRGYNKSVTAYTHGLGRISCVFDCYAPCPNPDEVIDKIGYDCEADVSNSPDSVFCSHGGGYLVKWDEVFDKMHLPLRHEIKDTETPTVAREYKKIDVSDDELLAIYERTYGKIQQRKYTPPKRVSEYSPPKSASAPILPLYLLVDGYNIIFAWDDLKKLAEENLDAARAVLIDKIANYRAIRQIDVIVVFDAYKVHGGIGSVDTVHGVTVVYTKEAETADAYIEKTSKKLIKKYRVQVATSDNLEQIIIFGNGAQRIPASEFRDDVLNAEKQIRDFIGEHSKGSLGTKISDKMEFGEKL